MGEIAEQRWSVARRPLRNHRKLTPVGASTEAAGLSNIGRLNVSAPEPLRLSQRHRSTRTLSPGTNELSC